MIKLAAPPLQTPIQPCQNQLNETNSQFYQIYKEFVDRILKEWTFDNLNLIQQPNGSMDHDTMHQNARLKAQVQHLLSRYMVTINKSGNDNPNKISSPRIYQHKILWCLSSKRRTQTDTWRVQPSSRFSKDSRITNPRRREASTATTNSKQTNTQHINNCNTRLQDTNKNNHIPDCEYLLWENKVQGKKQS